MADISEAFKQVCKTFKISKLNPYQQDAFMQIVEKNTEVFINLPTGFGKSLIYQALPLPLTFDIIHGTPGHIIIVVSPLINLMKDQVANLTKLGIPAVSLSDIKAEHDNRVEEGHLKVVYGSPECWLNNDRWRKVFSKLCAITVDEAHAIKQW